MRRKQRGFVEEGCEFVSTTTSHTGMTYNTYKDVDEGEEQQHT